MKEIRCPKCGSVFQVDEADYASILSQVKNAEFDKELERRLADLHQRQQAEQQLMVTKTEQTYQSKLNQKDLELNQKAADMERQRAEMEARIAQLQSQLAQIESVKKSEMTEALAAKDQTIAQLNSTIEQNQSKLQLAVLEEKNKAQQEVQAKEAEITQLRSAAEVEKREAQLHEQALKDRYAEERHSLEQRHTIEKQLLEEQIARYKDMKTRLSTKMVGETLEQHCSIEYEQHIRPFMPNAYFDKDNEAVGGTKGDFIFRDKVDDIEYISIMFEMKNEMDETATKHKNDDFLKKLDEDRRKKGCEFAVLVSMLEADNELYNMGIVNKSHLYDKMYVIRPQFFVPLINLLVQTSKKSLEYRRQLAEARSKEIDVTNFEDKMNDFKTKFSRHFDLASRKFDDAIKQIDDTIAKLMKIKESLIGSENNLRLAQQDTEDLTIRKLTFKNPTMKQKFEEAKSATIEIEQE